MTKNNMKMNATLSFSCYAETNCSLLVKECGCHRFPTGRDVWTFTLP